MTGNIEPVVIDGVTIAALLTGEPAGVRRLDRYVGQIRVSSLAVPIAIERLAIHNIEVKKAAQLIQRLRLKIIPFDDAQAFQASQLRLAADLDLSDAATWLIARGCNYPLASVAPPADETVPGIKIMRLAD